MGFLSWFSPGVHTCAIQLAVQPVFAQSLSISQSEPKSLGQKSIGKLIFKFLLLHLFLYGPPKGPSSIVCPEHSQAKANDALPNKATKHNIIILDFTKEKFLNLHIKPDKIIRRTEIIIELINIFLFKNGRRGEKLAPHIFLNKSASTSLACSILRPSFNQPATTSQYFLQTSLSLPPKN